MAVQWSTILKAMPTFLAGLLPGIGAGRMAAGAIAERALSDNLKGVAFDYPTDMAREFEYPLADGGSTTTVDGKVTKLPSLNAGIDRGNLGAALVQEIKEHNRAVKGGYEKTLEGWWPGEDVRPRKVIHPTSSAVNGIKINTDGTVQVQWKNGDGKWYTYRKGADIRESSRMVQELISSPSIGRALVRKGRFAHADSKDLTANPVRDRNVGWWGRKYFNPTIGMIRTE